MNIKQIKITKFDKQRIEQIAHDNFILNEKSIYSQDIEKARFSNLIGAVGEYFFKQIYPEANKIQSFDYDFLLNNKTIDVKTKCSNGAVKDYFTVTIPKYQIEKQKTQYYSFFIVDKNLTNLTYCGNMSKDEFTSKATFYKKGAVVERNKFIYVIDTYSLEIIELREGFN